MARVKFFTLQVLGYVVLLGFCACQQADDAGQEQALARGMKEVEISSSLDWIDTGVDLQPGKTVQIIASGQIFINKKTASSPGGVTDSRMVPFRKLFWKKYSVLSDAAHGALLGKIGEKGKPFFVGEQCKFTADSKGRLYLGVNDKDRANNRGAYRAVVSR